MLQAPTLGKHASKPPKAREAYAIETGTQPGRRSEEEIGAEKETKAVASRSCAVPISRQRHATDRLPQSLAERSLRNYIFYNKEMLVIIQNVPV
jgi:hypothetical protein